MSTTFIAKSLTNPPMLINFPKVKKKPNRKLKDPAHEHEQMLEKTSHGKNPIATRVKKKILECWNSEKKSQLF